MCPTRASGQLGLGRLGPAGAEEQKFPEDEEPAASRGGCSLDLPWPSLEQADQTGRQRHSSQARRCLGSPGGLACLLSPAGRGLAGGGEAPGDCADASRKLASKFYQLSMEEVGAGLELETCMVMSSGCPWPWPPWKQCPRPPLDSTPPSFTAGPRGLVANWRGWGRGHIRSRSRNQGQDCETLADSPSHQSQSSMTSLNPYATARSLPGPYPYCMEADTEAQNTMSMVTPGLRLKHRHTGRKQWPFPCHQHPRPEEAGPRTWAPHLCLGC